MRAVCACAASVTKLAPCFLVASIRWEGWHLVRYHPQVQVRCHASAILYCCMVEYFGGTSHQFWCWQSSLVVLFPSWKRLIWNKYSANWSRSITKPTNVNLQQNALCCHGRCHFGMAITHHPIPLMGGFCECRRFGSGFALDSKTQAFFGLILSEERCALESCKY